MITLWVLRVVLLPHGDGVTDEILFCEHDSVPFRRVNGRVKLEHILKSADKNRVVLLLVAAIVKRQNSGAPCREFDKSRSFRCQRLGVSMQQLTSLVSVPA
jgi:hypothetical protein